MSARLVNKMGVVLIAALLVVSLGACKKKTSALAMDPRFDSKQYSSQPTNNRFGIDPQVNLGPEATTNIENLPPFTDFELDRLQVSDTGLKGIYFDYNSYALSPQSIETLKGHSDYIRRNPDKIIQIEGHCDERGTQEFNLALGEKRALAVRSHLINLGVSGDRLITISYGEEDPANGGHDENAWAQNRRAEFNG